MSLMSQFEGLVPKGHEASWRSPSNIAFVKYWGKKGHQIPANPSLSMTLKECFTETKVTFTPSDYLGVELFLDGKKEEKFAAKIKRYLETLEELPFLKSVSFTIETKNTFPHGTGIASSASGLSAFALCLTDYLHHLTGEAQNEVFFKRASHLSRLASGSACRSVYGGFTSWGDVSDKYASPFEVHREISDLMDTVLVVSGDEKAISSTQGHGRMSEHPFAEARFGQAKDNYKLMSRALKTGDLELMGSVLETEALSLHAMMLTSPRPYTLLKPGTLTAIELVQSFRRETSLPLYFTLDAGPNLHLIYPRVFRQRIQAFITDALAPLSQKVIEDEKGQGPQKC